MEINQIGETAVILSVSYDKTGESAAAIHQIRQWIQSNPHPSISSIRPGLDSLLIEHSGNEDLQPWLEKMKSIDFTKKRVKSARLINVPVCYELGYDLSEVAAATQLSQEAVIELHSHREYEVWMIGFMPGFPYMGELSSELQLPRKKNPDPSIPAGSVAIAEEYVGIYPFQSPGGWHVIGRTPLKVLDYTRNVPWTFDYDMRVKFEPISLAEFEKYKQ
jgi:KipI family sensor histidine kinase inhibitor